jgi:hypothetical protein
MPRVCEMRPGPLLYSADSAEKPLSNEKLGGHRLLNPLGLADGALGNFFLSLFA